MKRSFPWLAAAFAAVAACSTGGSPAPGDDDDASSGSSASGGAGGAVGGGAGVAGAAAGTLGQGGATGGGAGAAGGAGVGVGGAGAGMAGAGAASGASGAAGVAGATAGTGGAAGSVAQGGDAGISPGGTAGAAGASAGGGAGGATATGFVVDDFESGTVGQQPAGWGRLVTYNAMGPNPNGEILALVDDAHAHSGTKSVHFHGSSEPAQLTRTLPIGTTKLYVRAWVYLTRQLGMNPGANHETLIGIRKAVGSVNDEVRFGEIKGVIGTNEMPSDNISPKMDRWGMGPVVPANAWACFEVAFLADQAQHTLHAWVDGTLVHEITAGDQWQNGPMPANWLDGKFVEAIIGWQSFSNVTTDLWMDDVILSNDAIGCN